MEMFVSLAALLGALTVGAISPGPSFVFVARTSVARSRGEGLAAACGMGLGGVIFAVLVLVGLQALLARFSGLFLGLKIAGALYLLYLAVGLWRGANRLMSDAASVQSAPAPGGRRSAFFRALLIQLSNPKALVVYGSMFAALLPRDLPRTVAVVLPGLVFLIEAGWYSIVAVALSSASPRKAYFRCKPALDKLTGGVLGLLGIKLLLMANSSR